MLEKFEEWLGIQWTRFNIWLDYKLKKPGRSYGVTHAGGDKYIIRESQPVRGPEYEERKRKEALAVEHNKRRRALMTQEQRDAEDAALAKEHEKYLKVLRDMDSENKWWQWWK